MNKIKSGGSRFFTGKILNGYKYTLILLYIKISIFP